MRLITRCSVRLFLIPALAAGVSCPWALAQISAGLNCDAPTSKYGSPRWQLFATPNNQPSPDLSTPTHIATRWGRYCGLVAALDGYSRSAVPLVSFEHQQFVPAGAGDDIGIYYVIPGLARLLRLPLSDAIDLFLILLIGGSHLIGISGVLALFKSWQTRLFGILLLLVSAAISFAAGDVYIVSSGVAVATVPWVIYMTDRLKTAKGLLAFLFWAGFALGCAHLFRAHSATPVLVFVGFLLVFSQQHAWKFKCVALVLLLAGSTVPLIWMRHVVSRRDAYLIGANPGYSPALTQHVVWHPMYVGFGFLSNDDIPRFDDAVAVQRVEAIAPEAQFLSAEYEHVLRKQVFLLFEKHPLFVITTVAAKLGVVGLYLLVFANVGLIAAFRQAKGWKMEAAFWGALVVAAIPAVITVPRPRYLLGFVALALLYGIVSVGCVLEANVVRFSAPGRAGGYNTYPVPPSLKNIG